MQGLNTNEAGEVADEASVTILKIKILKIVGFLGVICGLIVLMMAIDMTAGGSTEHKAQTNLLSKSTYMTYVTDSGRGEFIDLKESAINWVAVKQNLEKRGIRSDILESLPNIGHECHDEACTKINFEEVQKTVEHTVYYDEHGATIDSQMIELHLAIYQFTSGAAGKLMAILMLLMGLFQGVAMQNIMGMLAGVVGAAIFSFMPTVMIGMAGLTQDEAHEMLAQRNGTTMSAEMMGLESKTLDINYQALSEVNHAFVAAQYFAKKQDLVGLRPSFEKTSFSQLLSGQEHDSNAYKIAYELDNKLNGRATMRESIEYEYFMDGDRSSAKGKDSTAAMFFGLGSLILGGLLMFLSTLLRKRATVKSDDEPPQLDEVLDKIKAG